MSAINTIQLANGDEYDINDVRITSVPVPISEGGTAGTTKEIAKYNLELGEYSNSNFKVIDGDAAPEMWGMTYTINDSVSDYADKRITVMFTEYGGIIQNNTNSTTIGCMRVITYGTTDPSPSAAYAKTGVVYLKKRSS